MRARCVGFVVTLALLPAAACSPAEPDAGTEHATPTTTQVEVEVETATAAEPAQVADAPPPEPEAPQLREPTGEEVRGLLVAAYDRATEGLEEPPPLREWFATQRRVRVEGEQWIYELQYSRSGDGALPGDSRDEVFVDHGPEWRVQASRGGGHSMNAGARRIHSSSFAWRVVARPIDQRHLDAAVEFAWGTVHLPSDFREWR